MSVILLLQRLRQKDSDRVIFCLRKETKQSKNLNKTEYIWRNHTPQSCVCVLLGTEPRALCMVGKPFTTELYP